VTTKPGEEFLESCIAPKCSDYSAVMIWGAIRGGKKSEVVVWDKKCWGSIEAKAYCDNVLYPALFPFWLEQSHQVGGPVLFMKDGAELPTLQTASFLLAQYKIPWPASFPDLNPIENIWNLLKTVTAARNPRPTKVADIIQAAKEEWALISEEDILHAIGSLPERVQACI